MPVAGENQLLALLHRSYCSMVRAESSAAMLLSEDDTERQQVWSWWRRGREPVSEGQCGELDAECFPGLRVPTKAGKKS